MEIKPKFANHQQWINYFKIALAVFVIFRLVSSAVLLIGIIRPPFVVPFETYANSTIQDLENGNFFSKYILSPWFRWDTVHYVGIAENGYDSQSLYTVWPPLYPFLIKLFSFIFKPPLLASIIVANIFFIASMTIFLKLLSELYSDSLAKQSLLYFLIFPSSFFLIAPYTESIFITLSLAVIYASIKKKWLLAGILSGFAALSRVQGILLVLPIIIEGIRVFCISKDKKEFFKIFPAIFFAPFTYGIFCLYVRYGMLEDWPWVTLNSFWGQHFGWPWEGLLGNITVLLGREIETEATLPVVKFASVVITLFSIYFLIKVSRKLPLSISIYSWVSLILALSKVSDQAVMVSTIRYLLPIFPIFIGQAIVMDKKWMKVLYFPLGVGVNLVFIIFNYWWIWVA